MAITYKLFLDERTPKGNKKFALKLRITYNRKHKVIPMNIELLKEDWNAATQKVKSSHPNAKLITLKINQSINEVQEKALKFETTEKVYNVEDLAENGSIKPSNITFLSFADGEVQSLLKAGRIGNANAYKGAINKLIKFAGTNNLKFEQIDYKFLDRFTQSMLAEEMKLNAIAVHMREIRAIFNKAIKAELVEQKYYPFSKYKIRTTKTISRALTIEEMKKIVQLQLEPNTAMWHSRNYFLLSFCLIGTNFADLFRLTPDSIAGDRVIFSRSKTHKVYSIKLHPMAAEILKKYNNVENESDYLLPILNKDDSPEKQVKDIAQATKTTNEYLYRIAGLCSLKQEITTYYARYSWANICKGLGHSKDIISEALGHSYGLAVTGIYLDNYGNEIIDAANAKVISAVFN